MRQNSGPAASVEHQFSNLRRVTCKRHSTDDKFRIVLSGLRGKESIAELCRHKGIARSLYCSWSKEFLWAGDTARARNRASRRRAG